MGIRPSAKRPSALAAAALKITQSVAVPDQVVPVAPVATVPDRARAQVLLNSHNGFNFEEKIEMKNRTGCRLFVCNLPANSTDETLKEIIARVTPMALIDECYVNPQSRFAFITLVSFLFLYFESCRSVGWLL